MTETIYDAEFVDVNPQAGYAAAGPATTKTAHARKAKKQGAAVLVRAHGQKKPPRATSRRTSTRDFGRLDILLQKSLKKFVEESNNGILMAAYGRYGDLVNDAIRSKFGPNGRKRPRP